MQFDKMIKQDNSAIYRLYAKKLPGAKTPGN